MRDQVMVHSRLAVVYEVGRCSIFIFRNKEDLLGVRLIVFTPRV